MSYMTIHRPPLNAVYGTGGGLSGWPEGCDQGHRVDISVRIGQLRTGMGSQP